MAHPLGIWALAQGPLIGSAAVGPHSLASLAPWVGLPMSQPRFRGAPSFMPQSQAVELLAGRPARIAPRAEQRFGIAPAGVLVFDGVHPDETLADLADVVLLASPVVSRLASLEEVTGSRDRLGQQT